MTLILISQILAIAKKSPAFDPEDTTKVVTELAKGHYNKKDPPMHGKYDYTHRTYRIRLKNSEVSDARTRMHDGLVKQGYIKREGLETSNHYNHPTSKNVVNFRFKTAGKKGGKHTDMHVLHIHPTPKGKK